MIRKKREGHPEVRRPSGGRRVATAEVDHRRALRERNANADERGIRVVRQWQALALLSGAAAHGRPNGSSFDEPHRRPDARDCTHSSPDSMVYQLQAFFAALLGGGEIPPY